MNQPYLIKPVWLRLLLFIVVLLVMNMLLAGILSKVPLLPAMGKGGEPQNIYAGVIGSFVASMATLLIFRRYIDRKSFLSLGLEWPRPWQLSAGVGFLLALVVLGSGTLTLAYTSHLTWTDVSLNPGSLVTWAILMAMVAMAEELVFRGYILGNLLPSMQKWKALAVSALVFALFHGYNPETGWLALANIFLAGLLLGINFIHTRNCWFGLLFHFAWNFFQGPVLGYPVSGLRLPGLLQQQASGNNYVTGGNFGFEGSILYTLLTLLSLVSLSWIYGNIYKYNNRLDLPPTV